ncbi:MAG: transporter [Steroidobacteraceae bacterium]
MTDDEPHSWFPLVGFLAAASGDDQRLVGIQYGLYPVRWYLRTPTPLAVVSRLNRPQLRAAFTDDTLNGSQYLDGHRSKVFAAGPQVRYQFAKGGTALKWLHETSAENRPQGDRFQLQFAVPF